MISKIDLSELGFSARYAQEAQLHGDNFRPARVSVQHKDLYKVVTEDGEILAEVSGKLDYLASETTDYPVVGDWVLVDRTDNNSGNAIIHHILNRKSYFERKAAGTGHARQIIAANIDTVFVCMSLNNDFNLRRIERYLSIAWESMATPVIVLTKADLCNDLSTKLGELNSVAPGVDVVVTSSRVGNDCTELVRYLKKGKTAAFVGSSGVGKSTLINRLMGKEVLATRETREDDDKGRHTTTHRQMLILPEGGIVIDTPGIRELQIAEADLSKSFSDIVELAAKCFFRDCRHESEPRCAVRKAVHDGRLSAGRLESYKKLQREMAFTERKSTMTAAQAEKQKTIDMMGSLDGCKKILKASRKNKKR